MKVTRSVCGRRIFSSRVDDFDCCIVKLQLLLRQTVPIAAQISIGDACAGIFRYRAIYSRGSVIHVIASSINIEARYNIAQFLSFESLRCKNHVESSIAFASFVFNITNEFILGADTRSLTPVVIFGGGDLRIHHEQTDNQRDEKFLKHVDTSFPCVQMFLRLYVIHF